MIEYSIFSWITLLHQDSVMSDRNKDNTLELTQAQEIILSALRERERYGLEILEAIEKGAGRKIGVNTLYPTLKKLEERGFVTSRWGDESPEQLTGARRRYFRISGLGTTALNHRQEMLEAVATWDLVQQGGVTQ